MSLTLVDLPARQPTVPRNGKDQPMVVPLGGGVPKAHARTTTFIDVIEDKSTLTDWKAASVLVGASRDSSIIERLRAADPYGDRKPTAEDRKFRTLTLDLVEECLTKAGAHDKREKGTALHEWSELLDTGRPLPDDLDFTDMLDLAEYRRLVVKYRLHFSRVETFTVCPALGTAGTPDRIASFGVDTTAPDGSVLDGPLIEDLKTGTIEYGRLKMAAQLAIYSRSMFYDPTVLPAPPYAKQATKRDDPEGFAAHKAWREWCETEFTAEQALACYSPLPDVSQEWGVIINVPSSTGEGSLQWVDLTLGWELAQLAGVVREARRRSGDALTPFAP